MRETPETSIAGTATAAAPAPAPVGEAAYQSPRVFRFAAWVAIVAGTVFIVAVIFFTGFVLGRHAGFPAGFPGGLHRGHRAHPAMMKHPGGPGGGGPAAVPGGGSGTFRPGAGPGQVPSSLAPLPSP
ncbi:MAG: hypothetical protein PHQ28_04295 [Mycobacterium sp.]|nr:hypothetical protein [Mycobacterium sp.]